MALVGKVVFLRNEISLEINALLSTGIKTFASSASAFVFTEAMLSRDHCSDE